MRPTKLSSKVFLEFPPVLAHYLQADRNLWLDGNPKRGRISLLNRSGSFIELEALAVERRQLIQMLGKTRARALKYHTGFEQGRRDGARQFESFSENARLALQAALVFGQLQGRFIVEPITFEFDLDAGTLYREIVCHSCVEAVIHRMTLSDTHESVCWGTAGYLSGHMSEILGRNVVTLETECVAKGGECCRFISKLEHEFGQEIDWVRESMSMASMEDELAKRSRLVVSAQKAARRAQSALGGLRKRVRSELLLENIVARSEAMEPAMRRTRHLCTTTAPILITGEAGTGKETQARAIHGASERRERPFLLLDCQALSSDTAEQELFGYPKESVPGMAEGRLGALARAEGGTLYIEEICEMGLESQARLLSALNDGEYLAEGSTLATPMDVRIVASTQLDPKNALADGMLDEGLYYALAIGRIDLPPLRDRGPDIIPLAEKFLRDAKERHGRSDTHMSEEFKEVLLGCAWPGNLRQLNTVVEHAVLMSTEDELGSETLPDEILADRWTREPKELTEDVIRAALNRTRNNRSKAAELLGVGRTTLWRAMKRLDVA